LNFDESNGPFEETMVVNDPAKQSPAAKTSGADARRERAIRNVRDAAFAVLLAADSPQRTTDLARSVAERCGLATDEATLGAVAPLVRMVLDSDHTFVHTARLWDLSAREGNGETDRRRPVERAIEELIQNVGMPVAAHEVAPLVAAVYGREPEYYRSMIERMAPTRPQFFVAPMGRVGLTRWLLEVTSDEAEDVELDNFDTAEELATARASAGQVKSADGGPLEYARAIIEAADSPLTNRALSFVVWAQFRDIEPQALFNDLLVTDPDSLRPGPVWESAATRAADRAAILELAGSPELAQSAVAAAAPAEEVAAPTAPIQTVGDEDLDQVYQYMSNDLRTYRLSELCQEVLESFPGSRNFTAVRDALRERLRADSRFVWAGTERFRLDGTMPDEIEAVPEGLAFDERIYTNEDAEAVDKLLPPDRWKHLLEQQVQDPLVQDLGDDDTRPSGTPEGVRAAIPMHHYVAGTLYVHHQDRPFFPLEPDLVSLDLVTPDGQRLEVWLNNRFGLIFGLKEWYDAHLPWTGGVYALEPTEQPDEYRLVQSEEIEPALDIPMERLQSLLQLRAAAEIEAEALTLTEVLTRMLKGQSSGIPFVRLFSEVNVVRRSRRALVASVLSGHRGFQQRPEQPGIWFFDEKRAEKATRKAGRPKRIREFEEEDDLEDE
jgi:hypothetical protein